MKRPRQQTRLELLVHAVLQQGIRGKDQKPAVGLMQSTGHREARFGRKARVGGNVTSPEQRGQRGIRHFDDRRARARRLLGERRGYHHPRVQRARLVARILDQVPHLTSHQRLHTIEKLV